MRNSLTVLGLSFVLSALICGCDPLPPSGYGVCTNGRVEPICVLPSGEGTDRSMIWFSVPSCSGDMWGAHRWRLVDGVLQLGSDHPAMGDRGGPSMCSDKDEALCSDGSAPVCEWWATPQQDWQSTCLQLMTDEGATEADCYFPLARYPLSEVDSADIYLNRVVH